MPPSGTPTTLEEALARIGELEAGMSSLRHDIRGILSPAMLMADTICGHADPRVRRIGALVVDAVQRVADRLQGSSGGVAAGAGQVRGAAVHH